MLVGHGSKNPLETEFSEDNGDDEGFTSVSDNGSDSE